MRNYIRIKEFCRSHDIEESFVFELQEFEVIHIAIQNDEPAVEEEELPRLEKMLRLHRELNINPEGLQAVHHLLNKMKQLQEEVRRLKAKINRLEDF